jgi:excisionase family DNA binding protein
MADTSLAPTASGSQPAKTTTKAIASGTRQSRSADQEISRTRDKHESREKQTLTAVGMATRLGGSNRLIGVRETAARLDVPVSTLYTHWREWQLTAYRVGRALKFRERDIEVWLERLRVDGVA